MDIWKKISTVVPGPAILFVGTWLDLFSSTFLVYPNWQLEADRLSLALGALVSIVLSILLSGKTAETLRRLAWAGFVLALVFLGACAGIWFHLGSPLPPEAVQWWHDVWRFVYILAMVSTVATITLAAMSLQSRAPKLYLWLFVVLAVVLVMVGIGVLLVRLGVLSIGS